MGRDIDSARQSKHKRKKKMLLAFAFKFGDSLFYNYAAACAAQAAFFILLSIVPMVSLILAVATYLPFSQNDLLKLLMAFIPNDLSNYVEWFITDLYSRAGSTVISVSAIATLWSASKGVAALMDGFNSMYKIRSENKFAKVRFLSIIYTIIFIILFAAVMSLYVTVSHYYQRYIKRVFKIGTTIIKVFLFVRYLMGWLLFYFFILIMYVVLPGGFGIPMGKEEHINFTKRVRSQMPGAAFTSVAWLVISRIVVIYIEHFPNISVMYGSLAGIVIVMLWLYFCMYFLMIGAVINYFLSEGYLTRVKKMLK